MATVMNYHIENMQGQRNTADGFLSIMKEVLQKVAPEQYHIDGIIENMKTLDDKCAAQAKHIKLLTEQLDEAGVTIEATGYEETIA